jgi:hypothetical protein
MADQCQPIVARSCLLYTLVAVRGQSPEVPTYRFLEMRHVVDVERAKAVRWLSRATRNASRRAPRSVVITLSFLGKRSGPMPSESRVIAKELFKHSGHLYWGMPSAK